MTGSFHGPQNTVVKWQRRTRWTSTDFSSKIAHQRALEPLGPWHFKAQLLRHFRSQEMAGYPLFAWMYIIWQVLRLYRFWRASRLFYPDALSWRTLIGHNARYTCELSWHPDKWCSKRRFVHTGWHDSHGPNKMTSGPTGLELDTFSCRSSVSLRKQNPWQCFCAGVLCVVAS